MREFIKNCRWFRVSFASGRIVTDWPQCSGTVKSRDIFKLQLNLALELIQLVFMKRHVYLMLLMVLAASFSHARAQVSATNIPEVIEHAAIQYPPLARQARIQGQVLLRVTTNGHVVTDVIIEKGHPLLAATAEQNVRTWKFVEHPPATFNLTFNFREQSYNGTFLQEPGVVEVVSSSSSGISRYTLPEHWNTQLQDNKEAIETTVNLWTFESFEPELGGYTEGPQRQERDLRNAHIDGNMVGFDATIYDKHGQRLKFSMIGKMTGDKIEGVFLNYWGAGGTWTAERAAPGLAERNFAPPSSGPETPIMASDVAYHRFPDYSAFALEASIEGTVNLRVATNGYSVSEVFAESGNPFLVRDASDNLRTWRFVDNTPRTFQVIYDYKIFDEKVDFLKQPGVVEIDANAPLVNGGGTNLSYPDYMWQAEWKSRGGIMRSTLSLAMSDDIWEQVLDGYVIGGDVGHPHRKEQIRQPHLDGDILGFDATLTGPNGRPVKVSVLGKRTGNKIRGVFLDYSGAPGTWMAFRQPSQAKPAR